MRVAPTAMATAPTTPKTFGRYVLFDQIAAGGMATVHLARLMGPIGFARTVAVKQMHAHLASDENARSMFMDEARMAARVRHPNAVPVLDVVAADRDLLLVMDYVHGESLARLVRSRAETSPGGDFPLDVASAIMIGVLHGLHAAHEAKDERGEPLGLVHRDVSPQNILVGLDGVPRVVDFGIAKAAGRLQTTTEGQLKGKASYLAPEQILGGNVDRRVDVYAAAVVLWEVLAGRRLFHGDLPASTIRQVLSPTYEPPSRYAPSVPAGVDRVVIQGLAFDPDARFATAWEMAAALEKVAPPASVRKISEWVEAIAGETLRLRAQRVTDIESASSGDLSALAGREEHESEKSLPTVVAGVPAASDASSTSLAIAAEPTPSRLTRSKRVAVAAIGIVALAVGAIVVAAYSARSPRPAVLGADPAPANPPPVTIVAAPTQAASASPATPDVSPDPSAASTASTTAPASRTSNPSTTLGVSAKPPRRIPASPGKNKSNCAVPFTWAPDGTKIPKPECM